MNMIRPFIHSGAPVGQLPNVSPAPVHIPASVTALLYNALPIVILSYGFWDQYSDYLQSQSLRNYNGNEIEEYDFVIVGAGSAGSVLANRLTESGDHKVLLLEAGGNPNPIQSVPVYFSVILHTPQVDYEFYTVPQTNACLALKEQRSFWPRGMGLGGCSNLNAMYYQRGNKNDFDKWAELSGSDEWKFDNILQNFKNVEDYHGLYFDPKWHSNDGKGVYVSISNEKRLLSEFLEAGREMGYPTKDVNGLQEASFSQLDVSIKNGRRFGAYDAFLRPALHRKNLQIYRYARVLQVKFKNRRAIGVTYRRHGLERFVRAKKEVILSAGAIDSPKILMLSGIGPKKHLISLGIRNIVNLPVGQNLQDHIMSNIGPFILETPGTTFHLERDLTVEDITNYFKTHTGPLSTPITTNAVAYIYSTIAMNKMKATNTTPAETAPDIQMILWPSTPALYPTFEKFASLRKGYIASYLKNYDNKDSFFVNVMLAKYQSRGEIKLASSNPMDKPLLNPRYFSHPDDIKVLVDGLNFTVTMIENTKAFQKHKAHLIDSHLPGCESYPLKSLQYYECYARHLTMTVYHQCGTCTMGKSINDPKAVVDYRLRVLQTEGLRVVDASIIPEIPNSNINAIVFMIADKASEMILDDWRIQKKSG